MSFVEKYKKNPPPIRGQEHEEKKKIECDPTSTMFFSDKQVREFEWAVRQDVWTLGQRCIEKVLSDNRG